MFERPNRRHLIAPACLLAAAGLTGAVSQAARRHMRVNSPLFNEISGRLGGAVGFTTAHGMFLRGAVTPSESDTTFQSLVRNILSTLSAAWSGVLTTAQRATWTNLAEDTPGASTGMNLFVKGNTERLRAELAYITSAPATLSTLFNQPPTAVEVTQAADNHQLDFTLPADGALTDPWAINDGGGMNMYVSRPQKATRLTKIKPYVFVGTLFGDTTEADRPGGAHSIDLDHPDLEEAFAAADVGDVVYVKFVPFTHLGQVGTPVQARIVVTAP